MNCNDRNIPFFDVILRKEKKGICSLIARHLVSVFCLLVRKLKFCAFSLSLVRNSSFYRYLLIIMQYAYTTLSQTDSNNLNDRERLCNYLFDWFSICKLYFYQKKKIDLYLSLPLSKSVEKKNNDDKAHV